MRTFPKALAPFREIVNQRGAVLRSLTWEEIKMAADTTESIEVESRQATISVMVEPLGESLKVVIRGFLEHKFFPGESIAMDGFYKHREGNITPMADVEFYAYD